MLSLGRRITASTPVDACESQLATRKRDDGLAPGRRGGSPSQRRKGCVTDPWKTATTPLLVTVPRVPGLGEWGCAEQMQGQGPREMI